MWEWEFPRNSKGEVVQVTDTQLTNFRDYISEIVDTYSWNSAMKCYVCTLKSSHGSFEMGTQDSYKETAEWCKKLGSAALLNRFNDVDGTKYQATLPAALRLKYKALGSWVKIDDGYDLPQS